MPKKKSDIFDEKNKKPLKVQKGGKIKSKKIKTSDKKKPTRLQKKVVDKIIAKVQKGGKLVLGEILREAGASKVLQDTPKKLTEGKGFKDYLSEKIGVESLAELQVRQLGAVDIQSIKFSDAVDDQVILNCLHAIDIIPLHIGEPLFGVKLVQAAVPNHKVRNDALRMIHQLQGNLKEEESDQSREAAKIVVEQLQLVMNGGQGAIIKRNE